MTGKHGKPELNWDHSNSYMVEEALESSVLIQALLFLRLIALKSLTISTEGRSTRYVFKICIACHVIHNEWKQWNLKQNLVEFRAKSSQATSGWSWSNATASITYASRETMILRFDQRIGKLAVRVRSNKGGINVDTAKAFEKENLMSSLVYRQSSVCAIQVS